MIHSRRQFNFAAGQGGDNLKGTYHAKCTFVRLLYMNMCPRCSRELTKCQKTQPSLFSSIPKSLKTGLQRIWSRLIQILTLFYVTKWSGSPRNGSWANSTNQEETATDIAVPKCWRRCHTYFRPLDGAVFPEFGILIGRVKLSKMRNG